MKFKKNLIGKEEIFSIETCVDKDFYSGKDIFPNGYVKLIIQGISFGDFDVYTNLNLIAAELVRIKSSKHILEGFLLKKIHLMLYSD